MQVNFTFSLLIPNVIFIFVTFLILKTLVAQNIFNASFSHCLRLDNNIRLHETYNINFTNYLGSLRDFV